MPPNSPKMTKRLHKNYISAPSKRIMGSIYTTIPTLGTPRQGHVFQRKWPGSGSTIGLGQLSQGVDESPIKCGHFVTSNVGLRKAPRGRPSVLATRFLKLLQLSTSSLAIHGGAIFSAVSGRTLILISAIAAPEHGACYRVHGFYLTTTFCSTLAQQAVSN